jgi:hypothetical protein
MDMDTIRIVPPDNEGDSIVGFGTKVVLPGGESLPCVRAVSVTCAGPEDFWEAEITCLASAETIAAISAIPTIRLVPDIRRSWWRKALMKAALLGA